MEIALKRVMKHLSALGTLVFYGIITGFFLFNDLSVFYKLFFTIIILMTVGILIRYYFFKDRPKKRESNTFLKKIDAASFPSLHSARVTALFLILYSAVNDLTKIFFLLVALLVMYSRIYLGHHRPYDILGGIILGIISSIFFI